MGAVRRLERPLPRARRDGGERRRELPAEQLRDLLVGPAGVLPKQHERIAEPPPPAAAAGAHLGQQAGGVARGVGPAIAAQVDVPERGAARFAVPLGVDREVRLDVLGRRRRRRRAVFQQERHLLREPAADDGVAAVEAQAQRLAVEHLLLHRLVDQGLELRSGRRPSPLRRPPRADGRDLFIGHRDDTLRPGVAQPPIEGEHARAEQQEHRERRSAAGRSHGRVRVRPRAPGIGREHLQGRAWVERNAASVPQGTLAAARDHGRRRPPGGPWWNPAAAPRPEGASERRRPPDGREEEASRRGAPGPASRRPYRPRPPSWTPRRRDPPLSPAFGERAKQR